MAGFFDVRTLRASSPRGLVSVCFECLGVELTGNELFPVQFYPKTLKTDTDNLMGSPHRFGLF